eukprot:1865517-Amphidinium_carterae.4
MRNGLRLTVDGYRGYLGKDRIEVKLHYIGNHFYLKATVRTCMVYGLHQEGRQQVPIYGDYSLGDQSQQEASVPQRLKTPTAHSSMWESTTGLGHATMVPYKGTNVEAGAAGYDDLHDNVRSTTDLTRLLSMLRQLLRFFVMTTTIDVLTGGSNQYRRDTTVPTETRKQDTHHDNENEVDTRTSFSYDMEGGDETTEMNQLYDMDENTTTWLQQIKKNIGHDLLELQKLQDMQDDMDDITETDKKGREANEDLKHRYWREATMTYQEGMSEEVQSLGIQERYE